MFSIALFFATQQTALKDVHIFATPLEKAVAQLSQIYGSRMDVSTLLRGKVILIEATQVSEVEIREQIAKTINATWEKKGDSWHLGKSSKQQNQDASRTAVMRSRFLAKTFDLREKTLKEKPEFTKALANQIFHQLKSEEDQSRLNPNQVQRPGPSPAGYGLPSQRLMTRFLLKFGMDRIAAIPNGQRKVFALHPNAMQSEIGVDIAEIIAKYRVDQETWLKSTQPILEDKEGLGKGSDQDRMVAYESLGNTLNNSFGSLPLDLNDILFTVYCSDDGAYDMKLTGLPSGKSDNIVYDIGGTSYEGAFAGMESADFESKPVEGFKLSEDSEDFKKFYFREFSKVPDARQASFMSKLSDPISKDPLAYGFSETHFFLAHRFKRNIVAMVSDDQLAEFEPSTDDFLFNDRFKEILKDFASVDEKWIRMFEFPFSEPNFPRPDLKRLIANVRANKKIGLNDRAAIAAKRSRSRSTSQVEVFLERFANSDGSVTKNLDALKIIGLLTESERTAAFNTSGIQYGQLSPSLQRHLFECCYFNQRNSLMPSDPRRSALSSVESEPTILAPLGITPNAKFEIIKTVEDVVGKLDAKGHSQMMMSAGAWGGVKYMSDHPEENSVPIPEFKIDLNSKFVRAKQTGYRFILHLSKDIHWESMLTDFEPDSSNTFTITTFPDDLKTELEAGVKSTAEASKRRKNGGGIFSTFTDRIFSTN